MLKSQNLFHHSRSCVDLKEKWANWPKPCVNSDTVISLRMTRVKKRAAIIQVRSIKLTPAWIIVNDLYHCFFDTWISMLAISFINLTCTWDNSEVTRTIETTTPLTAPENNNIIFPTASEVNNNTTTEASLGSERLCPGEWTRIGEGCYQFVTEEWVDII